MQYPGKLAFWEYADAELVLHVMEKQLELPAMQQIIDAYAELLVLQRPNVPTLERLVCQTNVCVELMQVVLEAHRNQPATLLIMIVNAARRRLVWQIHRLQLATKLTTCVFVEL